MHSNPAFRRADQERNIAAARSRSFGILSVNGAESPLFSHVPFVLNADGTVLAAHLTRSNPILRALSQPTPAAVIVESVSGYISPDWYAMEDQVPTYNYVAVHLRGRLRQLGDDRLRPHLDALSEVFERRLAPKPAWTADKMDDAALARMLRQIVPVEMVVDQVEGTWKLGQNKPDAARIAAAEKASPQALGDLMRNPPC